MGDECVVPLLRRILRKKRITHLFFKQRNSFLPPSSGNVDLKKEFLAVGSYFTPGFKDYFDIKTREFIVWFFLVLPQTHNLLISEKKLFIGRFTSHSHGTTTTRKLWEQEESLFLCQTNILVSFFCRFSSYQMDMLEKCSGEKRDRCL